MGRFTEMCTLGNQSMRHTLHSVEPPVWVSDQCFLLGEVLISDGFPFYLYLWLLHHLYKSTGHISKNFCSLSTVEWIIHLAGLTVVSVGGHVPPCAAGLVQTCPELSGEGASSPHSWSQQGRRVPRRPWEGRAAMLPSWVRSEREKETECMHPTCIFQLGNRTPI